VSRGHLGHGVVFPVAAIQIFFAELGIKTYGGFCRLHEQRAQESIALFADLN